VRAGMRVDVVRLGVLVPIPQNAVVRLIAAANVWKLNERDGRKDKVSFYP
jgi:hypothetical protein